MELFSQLFQLFTFQALITMLFEGFSINYFVLRCIHVLENHYILTLFLSYMKYHLFSLFKECNKKNEILSEYIAICHHIVSNMSFLFLSHMVIIICIKVEL